MHTVEARRRPGEQVSFLCAGFIFYVKCNSLAVTGHPRTNRVLVCYLHQSDSMTGQDFLSLWGDSPPLCFPFIIQT